MQKIISKSVFVLSLIALLFSAGSSPLQAAPRKVLANKVRQDRKDQALNEKIAELSIYREKLKGDYQILGFVQAQDAFTNKKTALLWELRKQAFAMGAKAIMEFRCKRMGKSILQSCEGFAITYGDVAPEVPATPILEIPELAPEEKVIYKEEPKVSAPEEKFEEIKREAPAPQAEEKPLIRHDAPVNPEGDYMDEILKQ